MTDADLSPSNLLSIAFAMLLMASVLLKLWLATRQMRHVAAHRDTVPAAFAPQIPLADHQKAADYTIAQGQFGLLELAWGTALLLAWTLLGGLSALNGWITGWIAPGLWQQVALVVAFGVIGGLLDLPWAAWRTFVLEQRFGFNRTTLQLWVQDLVKSAVVGAIIGIPMVTLVLWLMGATGPLWWLWTWGVWMGFNLLMLVVYPTWIAPLFNKFQPLEDAALKERVTALMQRCGFTSKGFYVMDGSRRSAHANAYFTGFGSAKRVVFYDTLLAQLTPAEVDAVLAHELGHFKHRHITKRIVSTFALSLSALALLGWLSQQVWFYTGLGVVPNLSGGNDALALLLFMMTLPVATSFVSPVFAQLSRKHEFEADAFAAQNAGAQDLANALLKLYKDNASTLTPDPVYVKFYYSHPPASERIARMVAHG
ncbi:M48 family metallopeptidase [Curvibacter sp. APW13]|uniref:M48 family metallopeptidase n=1 Tax=Curvibacter sp. APW13 TaxID=3077236 RepID=UPI0028DFB6D0|nr:M48 family metallopeptidase [Curvibacter sp. APW13]MDT8989381.1 M48 family metallopeptidase [Curvibacter sp. APW13]